MREHPHPVTRLTCLMLVAALSVASSADVLVLENGRRIEGRIVEETDKHIKLETRLGTVTLDRSQVRSVERSDYDLPVRKTRKEILQEEFAERLDATDPSDALALARIAAWCKESDLDDEAEEVGAMAVAIDHENEEVRRLLGHVKDPERGWLTPAEYHAARGLVEYEDEWITPAEKIRRMGRDYSRAAHRKRRELSVRAQHELANAGRELISSSGQERDACVARLRELLERYTEEGKPYLQGMRPQSDELGHILDLIARGTYAEARDLVVEVISACEGVQRWEEQAAIVMDVLALRGSLTSSDLRPSRRERQLLSDLNEMRRQMGVPPLVFDARLYAAAAGHNLDMIAKDYVAHDSPTPGVRDADDRGHSQGVGGQIGENIYYGGVSAQAALRAWGSSLGHAQNLFDAGWRRVGTCAVGRHWTQNFATGGR